MTNDEGYKLAADQLIPLDMAPDQLVHWCGDHLPHELLRRLLCGGVRPRHLPLVYEVVDLEVQP
jgi:hypothetical protein